MVFSSSITKPAEGVYSFDISYGGRVLLSSKERFSFVQDASARARFIADLLNFKEMTRQESLRNARIERDWSDDKDERYRDEHA